MVQYRVMMKQQRDGVDVSSWICKGCTNRQPSDVSIGKLGSSIGRLGLYQRGRFFGTRGADMSGTRV